MDPLTGAALAALLLGTPVEVGSASTDPSSDVAVQRPDASSRWDAEIAAAARRFLVPEAWIRAVMAAESAGDPGAVSPKGAMGLMQLMPETWREMRDRYRLGTDPFNPRDNVMAGTAFLRLMYDRFGAPGFLAAYNAGPQAMQDILSGLRPMPDESREFMAKVGGVLEPPMAKSAAPNAVAMAARAQSGLFFSGRSGGPDKSRAPSWRQLFAALGRGKIDAGDGR